MSLQLLDWCPNKFYRWKAGRLWIGLSLIISQVSNPLCCLIEEGDFVRAAVDGCRRVGTTEGPLLAMAVDRNGTTLMNTSMASGGLFAIAYHLDSVAKPGPTVSLARRSQ